MERNRRDAESRVHLGLIRCSDPDSALHSSAFIRVPDLPGESNILTCSSACLSDYAVKKRVQIASTISREIRERGAS